ncbi:hypothetical protein PHMEG_00014292 [Phytophthora megakarya]|uniref:Uncharacterized protein n=1 Tax=Phytophthora megakarya TaxID=4795 RepID=A0A225W587_9STRA|nr:hypothetical protein PHMEG_00014292 [Phytophthora megakarya]
MSAPFATRNRTTSSLPFSAAYINDVSPRVPDTLTLAPLSTRNRMTSKFPLVRTACINGVVLSLQLTASTSASFSMR